MKTSTGEYALRCGTILSLEPGRPPIDDGLIVVRNGTIQALDGYRRLKRSLDVPIQDIGDGPLVPGPINAHTHLELSHLQGRTTLGQGFAAWVESLIQLPMHGIDGASLDKALQALSSLPTAAVGDISGHNPRYIVRALEATDLDYMLFLEFLGFREPRSNGLTWPKSLHPEKNSRLSLSGHALYSTHPSTLQLCKSWANKNRRPFVIHLAESPSEVELLTTGRGALADLLKPLLLPDPYIPPGTSPVRYADQLGLLDANTLAVHCVQIDDRDIDILQRRRVRVCLCPRSNGLINVGRAPWEKMRGAEVELCLGTDSLCSNTDLDLWSEAEHLLQEAATSPSLAELMAMLCLNPARALGLEERLGSLAPGKKASFALVPDRIIKACTGRSTAGCSGHAG
jgi:cytosine/adenosine deaminase-related metal-dependent hydrolase